MRVDEAEALAYKIFEAIASPRYRKVLYDDILNADRERTEDALNGLRECHNWHAANPEVPFDATYSHPRRYIAEFKRLCNIYGVPLTQNK